MSSHSGFKRYVSNTSWLFAEKVFRIVIGLFITIWMARYLGPEQFGLLNYVISFVGLFGIVSTLGLAQIITKDLLMSPKASQLTMGTSFVLRLIGGIVLIPITAYAISIVRPENELLHTMVLIVSTTFLFQSFYIINHWFEAHVQAKYSVIITTIVMLISTSIKIILLTVKAPLIAFVWVIFVDSIINAIGLLIIFTLKSDRIYHWKFSFEKTKYLLKEAFPVILSGAAYMIFIRIDQVMLGNIVGDEEVGFYAAAVSISEGWIFIPTIIATSLFPSMLNARKNDYSLYLQRTQHLLNLMVLLGVSVAITMTFVATPFIHMIFGQSYSASSIILIIHIWGTIFTAISIVSFRYIIAEGLQIYSFYRAFAGLILNIVLNYILIPQYGAVGAAVATVMSQGVAVFILNSLSSKTRPLFLMQTKALMLVGSSNTLRYIKSFRIVK